MEEDNWVDECMVMITNSHKDGGMVFSDDVTAMEEMDQLVISTWNPKMSFEDKVKFIETYNGIRERAKERSEERLEAERIRLELITASQLNQQPSTHYLERSRYDLRPETHHWETIPLNHHMITTIHIDHSKEQIGSLIEQIARELNVDMTEDFLNAMAAEFDEEELKMMNDIVNIEDLMELERLHKLKKEEEKNDRQQ